jgi:uncharacterized protein (DUF983 family)
VIAALRLSRVSKAAPMDYLTGMNEAPPARDWSHNGISPYVAGLTCRCPRCGKGKLFSGLLTLRPRCEACGLDYAFADVGDGATVFIILISGFLVVGAMLLTEVLYQPPLWVHAMIWLPVILLMTVGPLRPMKATLMALQYHHAAAEGQLTKVDHQS